MTNYTNRLLVATIAAVAIFGLGCAAAISNANSSNISEDVADESNFMIYKAEPAIITVEALSAAQLATLVTQLADAQALCESACKALSQFHFATEKVCKTQIRGNYIGYKTMDNYANVGIELTASFPAIEVQIQNE